MDKVKLGTFFLAICIISGIITSNITYDKYNQVTSDYDWFGDRID